MRRTRYLALGAILLVALGALGAALFVLRRPTGPTLIAVSTTPLHCAGARDTTTRFVAPVTIAVGSDGALWFTEPLDHKIGRLTVTGQYREYCAPEGELILTNDLVTGPNGALWFLLDAGGVPRHDALGRLTLRGATSRYWPLPRDAYLSYLVVGPDHAFWLVSEDIVRIPPPLNASNAPAPRPLSGTRFRLGPPRFPRASVIADASVVVGPDGALWFAGHGSKSINDNDRGFIGRLAPSGATRLYDIPFGLLPRDIVVGPDKALWFTTYGLNGGGGHIGRLTLAGKMSDYALPPLPPGSHGHSAPEPADLIVGSDGLLWFVTPGYLGRIDRAGHTTYTSIPADDFYGPSYFPLRASTIVRGPDSALWATEDGGKIARVTADGTTTQYVLTRPPLPHS